MTDATRNEASLLLWTLLEVSEKAARIARECRSRKELFSLLVQEKTGDEKNPRVLHDFKTLADVLIQETVKHHLIEKFSALKGHIHGEETNEFTNAKGHQILVEVKSTEVETAELLGQVLDGNTTAAAILAHTVHEEPQIEESIQLEFNRLENEVQRQGAPLDDIAIWIDPIDATYEYIEGSWDKEADGKPARFGLNCCTILIGGFRRGSGVPCFAVVSQPFTNPLGGRTCSYFSIGNVTSIKPLPLLCDVVVSSTETTEVIEKLQKEFRVVHCAGAGYKMLTVALGWCNVFVCTKTSTYRWDICAPHALLQAQGGGVREFQDDNPIGYNVKDKLAARNRAGLIAYRNVDALEKVLTVLGGKSS